MDSSTLTCETGENVHVHFFDAVRNQTPNKKPLI